MANSGFNELRQKRPSPRRLASTAISVTLAVAMISETATPQVVSTRHQPKEVSAVALDKKFKGGLPIKDLDRRSSDFARPQSARIWTSSW